MPKAYFVVRSVVEAPLRKKFDHWYSSHHLPMALAAFEAEKCWRFWSAMDAGVHYAAYQFADTARLDAALKSDGHKTLVAEFDQACPAVSPAREIGSSLWRSEAGALINRLAHRLTFFRFVRTRAHLTYFLEFGSGVLNICDCWSDVFPRSFLVTMGPDR
jgi:hypothetical protein